MTRVLFEHDGKKLETSAENWIRYNTFDAYDNNGDSYVVRRDDCKVLDVIEE